MSNQSRKDRKIRVKRKFDGIAGVIRLMLFLKIRSVEKLSGTRVFELCKKLDHESRRQGNSPERRYKT